jgi:hypothetical protein
MDQPDLLEDGRSHARGPRIPPLVWRATWLVVVVAVAIWVVTSRSSEDPSTSRPPVTPAPADVRAAEQADVEVQLSVTAQREARIRDVPASYRDAASEASALHGGRTPGNFFLALAYQRTWYGELLTGSEGLRYVPFGPLQWEPTEFGRYADSAHGDITEALDSFLAIDNSLYARARPDFSKGAFGPARQLGLDRGQAASIDEIYEALDGWGVRAGLPN